MKWKWKEIDYINYWSACIYACSCLYSVALDFTGDGAKFSCVLSLPSQCRRPTLLCVLKIFSGRIKGSARQTNHYHPLTQPGWLYLSPYLALGLLARVARPLFSVFLCGGGKSPTYHKEKRKKAVWSREITRGHPIISASHLSIKNYKRLPGISERQISITASSVVVNLYLDLCNNLLSISACRNGLATRGYRQRW